MFVVNTEITVNYLLPHTTATWTYGDFDVRIIQPDGESTFIESALAEENFIAPTPDSTGAISYPFTPDSEGVWIVAISRGTAPSFDIYYEYFLRVSSPDTHVHQQVCLG